MKNKPFIFYKSDRTDAPQSSAQVNYDPEFTKDISTSTHQEHLTTNLLSNDEIQLTETLKNIKTETGANKNVSNKDEYVPNNFPQIDIYTQSVIPLLNFDTILIKPFLPELNCKLGINCESLASIEAADFGSAYDPVEALTSIAGVQEFSPTINLPLRTPLVPIVERADNIRVSVVDFRADNPPVGDDDIFNPNDGGNDSDSGGDDSGGDDNGGGGDGGGDGGDDGGGGDSPGSGTLYILTASNDTITGGTFDDTIQTTSANYNVGDSINGGAGADNFNLVDGGTFNFTNNTSNVETINLTDGASYNVTLSTITDVTTVDGDALTGSNALTFNAIEYGSSLTISSGAGADNITATAQTDTITTNDSNDTIVGGRSGDTISGGAGDDIIYGDALKFINTSVENLVVWLDGTDLNADSSVLEPSYDFAYWYDKSGNNNDAKVNPSQSTMNYSGLVLTPGGGTFGDTGFFAPYFGYTGQDYLTIVNDTDALGLTNSDYDIFIVYYNPGQVIGTFEAALGVTSNPRYVLGTRSLFDGYKGLEFQVIQTADGLENTTQIGPGYLAPPTPHLTQLTNINNEGILTGDGVSDNGNLLGTGNVGNTGFTTNGNITIGKGGNPAYPEIYTNWSDAQIGEVLIFNKNLSAEEEAIVEQYLSFKYGFGLTQAERSSGIIFNNDSLTGGLGADTFVYSNSNSSAPDAPDIISDFNQGNGGTFNASEGDVIRFEYDYFVRYNPTGSFSGARNEFITRDDGSGGVYLEADWNGDATVDFRLQLQDSGTADFSAANFNGNNLQFYRAFFTESNDILRGMDNSDDKFSAVESTHSANDILDAGTGNDILEISGGGTFVFNNNTTNLETINITDNIGVYNIIITNAQGINAINMVDDIAGATLNVDASGYDSSLTVTTDGNSITNSFIGSTAADTLLSGLGNDTIRGGSGNDSINAGGGQDIIIGDAGSDTLTGGSGLDQFHYNDSELSEGIANTDIITDLNQSGGSYNAGEGDVINLNFNEILTVSRQIGFSGVANELIWRADGSGGVFIEIDTDGDGAGASGADFRIQLNDVGGDFDTNDITDTTFAFHLVNLTTSNDFFTGLSGSNDIFYGTSSTYSPGDGLAGSTGTDTLNFSGGGTFNLQNNVRGFEVIDLADGGSYTINITNASGIYIVNGGSLTGSNTLTLNASSYTSALTITSGTGNDLITTSQGADNITSGTGADTYLYTNLNQASTSADVITDFNQGNNGTFNGSEGDKIALSLGVTLTYNTNNSFSNTANELIWLDDGSGGVYVEVDTDGDANADFRIQLQDSGNADFSSNDINITDDFQFNAVNLTAANDTLNGIANSDDTFTTTTANYNVGDVLNGNTGTDNLQLSGGGSFTIINNLNSIENLRFVNNASYTVALTTVVGLATVNASTLTGANTLNLDLTNYSSAITVTGGEGNDTYITSTTTNTGNAVTGGSGIDVISLSGGGSFTPGNNFSGFETVSLVDGASYTVTLETISGISTVTAADLTGSNTMSLDVTNYSSALTVTGGAGDDTYIASSTTNSANTLDGGDGTDVISLTGGGTFNFSSNFSNFETVELVDGNSYTINLISGLSSVNNIDAADLTGSNALTLSASAYPTALTVTSGAAADNLIVTYNADTVTSNAGADILIGGRGGDTLSGGADNDVIYGDAVTFTNTSVANLTLWLDAADIAGNSSITTNNTDIGAWADKSGVTGGAASGVGDQPTYTTNTLNGLPGLKFNSSETDFVFLPNADILGMQNSNYDVFIVFSDSTSGMQFLLGSSIAEGYEINLDSGAGISFIPNGAVVSSRVQNIGSPGDYTDGNGHIVNAYVTTDLENPFNFSLSELIADGVTSPDAQGQYARNPLNATLFLGARTADSFWYDGYISEVLIFSEALTDADRTSVEQYLSFKYNTSLPEGDLAADSLTGGLGADVFIYSNNNISTTSATDIITDFNQGNSGTFNASEGDVIRFEYDQTLVLNTSNSFSGTQNELIWRDDGSGGVYIEIDWDGNSSADVRVQLQDTGTADFSSSDINIANDFQFHAVTLTAANDTLNGIANSDDTFTTTTANYNVGDVLNGNTGTDNLQLSGGGSFTIINNLNSIENLRFVNNASYTVALTTVVGLATVNASTLTGANTLNLDLTNYSSAITVTGGEGNDTYITSTTTNTGNAVTGGSGTDVISLSGGGSFTLDNDFSGFETVSLVDGASYTVALTTISGISTVTAADLTGSNTMSLDVTNYSSTLTVTGGAGDDTYTASSTTNGANTLDGGNGTDIILLSGGGTFNFTGVISNFETINFVDGNSYAINIINNASSGISTINAANLTGSNALTLSASAYTTALTVTSGAGADNLTVTYNADTVTSNAGADILIGGRGGDTLSGGADNDVLYGDAVTFTNASVANLALWLDAADIAGDGTIIANSTDIATWTDKSGNGNHGTAAVGDQTTYTTNALNSLPGLKFNSSETDYITLPTASTLGLQNSDYDIFISFLDSTGGVQFLTSSSLNERYEIHLDGDAGLRFISDGFPGTVQDIGSSGDYTDGNGHVVNAYVANDQGELIADGVTSPDAQSAGAQATDATLYLGTRSLSSFWYDGYISEVLIFNEDLSDADRASVEQYLSFKYNTSLPEGDLAADSLTGGLGADAFVYSNNNISTTSATDIITDFNQGNSGTFNASEGDVIRFEYDQTLVLNTSNSFSGTQNELIWRDDGSGGVYMEIDWDGNSSADVRVQLQDTGTADFDQSNIDSSDFEFHRVIGSAGADTLNGTDSADTLDGSGGLDQLVSGAGDDLLIYDVNDFASGGNVDGGTGTDTLKVSGGVTVDGAAIDDYLNNIEFIDLIDGSDNNTLDIDGNELSAITDGDNDLYVKGDASDTVTTGSTWNSAGTSVVDSITYNHYTLSTDATVEIFIQQTVTQTDF